MNFRKLAICLALLLMGATAMNAQTLAWDITSQRVWNNYVATRIPDQFSSIVNSGGTLITNSNNSSDYGLQYGYNSVFTISLPFPFYYLGTTYPTGYTLRIGSNGYIGFQGVTSGYTYEYYYYYTWNYYNSGYPGGMTCIFVYNMPLSPVGLSDGGIYYRVDGAAPNRKLVVEWRTQSTYPGSGVRQTPGNFQAVLYEGTGKIEMFYGPSSIDCPVYPYATGYPYGNYYAGIIGLKNLGEYYYYSPIPTAQTNRTPADPLSRFFLATNPDVYVSPTDTVAYTGRRIFSYGSYGYAEYYPCMNYCGNSPCHIYRFPEDINLGGRFGYRWSPVFDDMSCDSIWLTPSVTANAYGVGATITVNARFANIGANARTNVPVRAEVYRTGTGGGLVYSATGTVSPGAQFSKVNFTFSPSVTSAITNTTGQYEVRVFPQLTSPMDQDFSNDTSKKLFYITKPNDVMSYAVLQPYQNVPPLYYQYPVGVAVPLEARFLNIGTNTQSNCPVGYLVYNGSGSLVASGTGVINGSWGPITFRDLNFSSWTPTAPGTYYVKFYTGLIGDENPFNDTLPAYPSMGYPFDVAYEIEPQVSQNTLAFNPTPNGCYPIGKPIPVVAQFLNDGISDVTNVPVNVTITNPSGQVVYNRNVTLLSIISRTGPGVPGSALQAFPDFIPVTPGGYTATATVTYPGDPITTNNTVSWNFCVKSPIQGTIRVGVGERFKTVQEAADSAKLYGVGGNVVFELVDDNYTLAAANTDGSLPALDWRGKIYGAGPNATITFIPSPNKTMVTINMNTYSGIGMWFGQLDTNNPSGYVTFDGGANKTLKFIYRNMNTNPADPYGGYTRAIPFYYGRGASNYAIRNCYIQPYDVSSAKSQYLTIPSVTYNSTFNQFTYTSDYSLQISSAIMLRNSLRPQGQLTSTKGGSQAQAVNPDTLRNQNNAFEGNIITGFGYGITSVGAGPLYVTGQAKYIEYNNQNNKYNSNQISNMMRGGIVLEFEKGSEVIANTISNIDNSTLIAPLPNTAGIASTAGANPTNNRGYSTDLRIERNKISKVFAGTGNAAGVSIETSENVYISPSNVTYRFPANGATNMQVWNNMISNVRGQNPLNPANPNYSVGVNLNIEPTTRINFVTTGNKIHHNTVYNLVGGSSAEVGILAVRNGGSIMNNIIDLVSTGTASPTGLLISTINPGSTVTSDNNLFWTPYGFLGQVLNLSTEGYNLPSMPPAQNMSQWRFRSKMDMNSIWGNVTPEFMSTVPGSENLHLNPTIVGGLASNRGAAITGLTNDLDNENRNPAGSTNATPDIGADEYNGAVYNYDLKAEDFVSPVGYQAVSGQFSDAEYVMVDTVTTIQARVRNLGGQPLLNNTATMTIDRWNGASWISTGVSVTKPVSIQVASIQAVNFGTFMPQTLRELAQNDGYYGLNPNVTPIYRIRVTTGGLDQNLGNDVYEKTVRFYVQRATQRKAILGVKYWAPTTAPSGIANVVDKGNKLNGDTIVAALNRGGWDRANGVGTEDFDLFERDKWPTYSDNFKPWKTVIWAQGEETSGLDPWERMSLKEMLDSRNIYERSSLLIAGQEVARIHDVALTSSNGNVADRDFVRNYLRTQYVSGTTPALYDNLRIKGVKVNPDVLEVVKATGVASDAGPNPAIVKTTSGNGVAYPSHKYIDQSIVTADTASGVSTFGSIRNAIYYAIDWRHMARLSVDSRSGAMRLAMGALDQFEQNKGILPIRLLSFEATQTGRNAVTVEWKTTSEVDIASMEIERAEVKDGEAGAYRFVDKRNGQGSASAGSTYRVLDEGVEIGHVYRYRLISVGMDGSRVKEEEKDVLVSGGATEGMELSVLPNPVVGSEGGMVNYRVSAGEKVRVVLYDESGKQVSVLKEGVEVSGNGTVSLPTLSSGSYTVVIESGAAKLSRRFVVKN